MLESPMQSWYRPGLLPSCIYQETLLLEEVPRQLRDRAGQAGRLGARRHHVLRVAVPATERQRGCRYEDVNCSSGRGCSREHRLTSARPVAASTSMKLPSSQTLGV